MYMYRALAIKLIRDYLALAHSRVLTFSFVVMHGTQSLIAA